MTQMAHGMEELLVHGCWDAERARETIDDSKTRKWHWREVLDNKGVPKNNNGLIAGCVV